MVDDDDRYLRSRGSGHSVNIICPMSHHLPPHPHGPPGVSAVVLNWNGGDLVKACVESVLEQDLAANEILVVDNGSSDGSVAQIRSTGGRVQVLELGNNLGFSAGMNAGIKATTCEYVLLLNLDVTLEAGYIRLCAQALAEDPQLGGVTGKLLQAGTRKPPIIDTTGHIVYRSRWVVDRGQGEPDRGQYDSSTRIFGVCGAAPMLSRAMLEDIKIDDEFFDEDFFAYFEDYDLSWRARLVGWGFGFVPGAIAHHLRGGSQGKSAARILAYNHVNRLFVMLKNDHPLSFLRHFPEIAYTEIRATLHMLRRRPAALCRAWITFFSLFSKQWRKRKKVQQKRRIGWRELEASFTPHPHGVRATLERARDRRSANAERLAR